MTDPTTMPTSGPPSAVNACIVAIEGVRASEELEPNVPLAIGRSRSSGIQVDDAAVSRLHATVTWDGKHTVEIEDHGSRNGTFVGEKRIAKKTAVKSGEVIGVGPARFVVVLPPSQPATRSFPSPMEHTNALGDRAARCDLSVLVLGETGSGKEVLARRIHAASARAAGPFVAVNCGSIPETLAESTLFGHEKGAFTGAAQMHPGVFEVASGGTLFLDEVGELPLSQQTRLLRVLEERSVLRVGATRPTPVDVRVIAATHRDLDADVAKGRFRRDLLYRLDVLRIRVPSLRERKDELPSLVATLLSELGGRQASVSADALPLLSTQPFPGNLRQLRNVLARALALSDSGQLDRAAIEAALPESATVAAGPLKGHVEDAERHAIEQALEATGGNQTHAAKRLGISRRALLYKMQRYGIARARERGGP